MNNKAFTLVELLGVFLLILILFVFISPIVTNIIGNSSNVTYDKQIDTILSAAYDFTLSDLSKLPNDNADSFVTLGELKSIGLVELDLVNPKTGMAFKDDLVIGIKDVGFGYKEKNKLSKVEGQYLYYIKEDTNKEDKPNIEIEGLSKNSDGNYILNVNLNDNYVEKSINATSSKGLNLNDNIRKYILLNGIKVDDIDTSKSTIYRINYVVIDENGNSASTVLNIIVSDTELPSIEFPSNNRISTEDKTFDLLAGVICTDNSGDCKITYSGEIKYGVRGKYIIEYKGIDPSGNTKTSKRVITIE